LTGRYVMWEPDKKKLSYFRIGGHNTTRLIYKADINPLIMF